MNFVQSFPPITPSITSSSKRHTRKIISINPIKEFIIRNLIRSHPPFAVISREHNIKISQIHQGLVKKLRSLQKKSNQVCVSTINTCKAKAYIMQKVTYINKLIIDQEILDKIWNRQTPKLSSFINNKRHSHQMHINIFEKDIESISVLYHRFNKKKERFM